MEDRTYPVEEEKDKLKYFKKVESVGEVMSMQMQIMRMFTDEFGVVAHAQPNNIFLDNAIDTISKELRWDKEASQQYKENVLFFMNVLKNRKIIPYHDKDTDVDEDNNKITWVAYDNDLIRVVIEKSDAPNVRPWKANIFYTKPDTTDQDRVYTKCNIREERIKFTLFDTTFVIPCEDALDPESAIEIFDFNKDTLPPSKVDIRKRVPAWSGKIGDESVAFVPLFNVNIQGKIRTVYLRSKFSPLRAPQKQPGLSRAARLNLGNLVTAPQGI